MFENMANPRPEKLQANWKGPYRIIKVGHGRAYYLKKLTREHLPHPWNISNLKRYFP